MGPSGCRIFRPISRREGRGTIILVIRIHKCGGKRKRVLNLLFSGGGERGEGVWWFGYKRGGRGVFFKKKISCGK